MGLSSYNRTQIQLSSSSAQFRMMGENIRKWFGEMLTSCGEAARGCKKSVNPSSVKDVGQLFVGTVSILLAKSTDFDEQSIHQAFSLGLSELTNNQLINSSGLQLRTFRINSVFRRPPLSDIIPRWRMLGPIFWPTSFCNCKWYESHRQWNWAW